MDLCQVFFMGNNLTSSCIKLQLVDPLMMIKHFHTSKFISGSITVYQNYFLFFYLKRILSLYIKTISEATILLTLFSLYSSIKYIFVYFQIFAVKYLRTIFDSIA